MIVYPVYKNRKIYQGTDVVWAYYIPNATLRGNIKRSRTESEVVLTFEVASKEDVHFLYLSAEATAALKLMEDTTEFVYDVLAVLDNGIRFCIEEGSLAIKRSVTND